MKTILDCEINQTNVVKKLHTRGALRQRLVSFGILKGAKITNLTHTALKTTYEIKIGKMNIALRASEAIKIEVA